MDPTWISWYISVQILPRDKTICDFNPIRISNSLRYYACNLPVSSLISRIGYKWQEGIIVSTVVITATVD